MASEYFEYTPDKLIEEVKRRPGLWDSSHPDYGPRNRGRLWKEIVAEIVGDAELTKSDLRELEIQIQKKWKGFRDVFIKYTTHPEKWKNTYAHYHRLKFLAKVVPKGPKSSKSAPSDGDEVASESDEEQKAKVGFRQKKIKLSRDSDDDEFDAPADHIETFIEAHPVTSLTSSDSKPYGEDSFTFASVDQSQRYDEDDPDRMFLLSLLPHLKAVPEQYRLNAKMDMMQVLRNSQFN